MSPELEAYLLTLIKQEEQSMEDIRQCLLATLKEYRGIKRVKELFEKAIRDVTLQC